MDKCIDRDAEREEFWKILDFEDDVRLLTIEDEGFRGKSVLLKRLRHECLLIKKLPVSLIVLDQKEENKIVEPWDFVDKLVKDLSSVDFKRFTIVNDARMLKNPAPFSETLSKNFIAVGGNIKDQAVVAAQVENVIQKIENVEKLEIKPREEWPNTDYEDKVRKLCIAAFFEDLRKICAKESIVILVDAWEQCPEELELWLISSMLEDLCFNIETRPEKLVFVMAGRKLPALEEEILGAEKYAALVRSLGNLNWKPDHLKEFLEINGVIGLDEEIIAIICEKVNAGKGLDWALNTSKAWVS